MVIETRHQKFNIQFSCISLDSVWRFDYHPRTPSAGEGGLRIRLYRDFVVKSKKFFIKFRRWEKKKIIRGHRSPFNAHLCSGSNVQVQKGVTPNTATRLATIIFSFNKFFLQDNMRDGVCSGSHDAILYSAIYHSDVSIEGSNWTGWNSLSSLEATKRFNLFSTVTGGVRDARLLALASSSLKLFLYVRDSTHIRIRITSG